MAPPSELPIKTFATAAAWETWLAERHASSAGLWLKIAKKASGIASVTYDEALDAALCFGWIDGQKKAFDDEYFLQKFTPRRPRSLWSKRNIEHVARLSAAGKMRAPGLAEVETAKRDGRFEAAYDSPSGMTVPEDFLAALEANARAKATFQSLNRANHYAIAWRLQTAKTKATRKRRFESLLAMLEKGERLH
ncbi:MAG TPA: YdeI/OmpD-associated family protein [Rectinemataceae bacterium]|nr:YdeI/OmpD-associated family protein [Rectinemataceae bacterium]